MDEKTRADNGFSGVKDVSRADVVLDNTMQVCLVFKQKKYSFRLSLILSIFLFSLLL